MICKRCAAAADIITQLHNIDEAEIRGQNDYKARDFYNVARTLHSLCKGCDCQHSIRKKGEVFTIVPFAT